MRTLRQGWSTRRSFIAADDGLRTCRESELQVLVVLWMAAVGHAHGRLKPDGRRAQNFQQALTPRERDRVHELRGAENRGNLGTNPGGDCEHVNFFGAQTAHAIRLERRACGGGGVEDDQSTALRSRRSAP